MGGRNSVRGCALAAGLGLVGCAAQRKMEPPGPVIRKVELRGVERFEPDEFHEYLNLRPTPALSFREKYYYVPGLEAVDEQRIEALYRSHGYYEAEVESIRVEVVHPERPVRKQKARVAIAVQEGPPTIARRVEFVWKGAVDPSLGRAEIERRSELAVGRAFGIAELQSSREALRDALRERGHAAARVVEEAWVDSDARVADVRFEIEPGPRYRIGRIRIEGLSHVPERLVQREVESVRGKPYSPARLRQVEASIYGLGVFATVSVRDGEPLDRETIDVVATVTESKLQRIQFGVGLGIDPVRWEQRVSMLYRHDSLFGELTRLEVRAKVGYAELPALYSPQQHGPIADLSLELRKKGLLEKHLVWTASPGVELGIWDGYQFYTLRHRLGVSRFFTRWFEIGLSYNNRFTDFFAVSPALNRNRTILGLDFRDPYFLSYFELTPTLHLTDDILRPRNGVRLGIVYDVASTYLGGQYDYQKIEPELRAYWQPHNRVQLALRSRVGLIFPFGRNPAAPIDLKFYLGGANDVRGWPLRRLSPRVELCDDEGDCDEVPFGGKSMFNSNFETRVRMVADLWLAAFFDLGDVRDEIAKFDARGFMYSTGGGLRYDSPIGVFRLDAGVRLNDDPRFPEPRRWAIHFGLGEAF